MTLYILQNNSYNTESNQGTFWCLSWVKLISFLCGKVLFIFAVPHCSGSHYSSTLYDFTTYELRLWAGSNSALQHIASFCGSKNLTVLQIRMVLQIRFRPNTSRLSLIVNSPYHKNAWEFTTWSLIIVNIKKRGKLFILHLWLTFVIWG